MKDNFLDQVTQKFDDINELNNTNLKNIKNDFETIEKDIIAKLNGKIDEFKTSINELETIGTNLNGEIKKNISNEKEKQLK